MSVRSNPEVSVGPVIGEDSSVEAGLVEGVSSPAPATSANLFGFRPDAGLKRDSALLADATVLADQSALDEYAQPERRAATLQASPNRAEEETGDPAAVTGSSAETVGSIAPYTATDGSAVTGQFVEIAQAAAGPSEQPQAFQVHGGKWGLSSLQGTAGGTVTWSIVGAGLFNQTGTPGFFTGVTADFATLGLDHFTLINNAFNAWSAVANINFTYVQDGGGNLGVGTSADIRIALAYIDGMNGLNILGQAFYPATTTGTAQGWHGDVVVDSGNSWTAADFYSLILHELGHSLGIEHSSDPTAVMYPYLNNVSTLHPDDIAAIQAIYGVRPASNVAPTITGAAVVNELTARTISFANTFTATDADGTIAGYRISDLVPGTDNGFLTLNGFRVTSGTTTVNASQLANVAYYTGSIAGSNTVEIVAIDNQGGESAAFTRTINVAQPTDDFANTTATTGVLAPGAPAYGNIEVMGDSDWFRINLTAGASYTFTLNSTGLDNPFLSFYDSNGVLITSNDNVALWPAYYDSAITITALNSGPYYLGASGIGTSVGSYTLTAVQNVPAPEVTVLGNGISIRDGSTLASFVDGTDFGFVQFGGTPVQRTFTVRNDGSATLTTSGLTVPTIFTVVEGLSSSIAAGASDTFTVQLNSTTGTVIQGDISFFTNDADENPFNFRIFGIVQPVGPMPEVVVLGNGFSIIDGDGSPSTSDHTDFGFIPFGATPVQRTFTVRNDGPVPLTTSGLVLPSGFTVVEGLSSSIAAGASDTFTVQLNTTVGGSFAGDISFATNDPNQNPFNFRISGVVQAPVTYPEVTVLGNGVVIQSGDTTASSADGTDFGYVAYGSEPVLRTFTVRNDGSGLLTTTGFTAPIGLTVVEGLSSSILSGQSDTFTIRQNTFFSYSDAGAWSGQISFFTNDTDENPYFFSVSGVRTLPLPDFTVSNLSLSQSTLNSGGSVSASFTLNNVGVQAGNAGTVSLYISTDNVVTTSDLLLGSVNASSLNASQSMTLSAPNLIVPGFLAAGTYYIAAVADSAGLVDEVNNGNNTSNVQGISLTQNPFTEGSDVLTLPAEGQVWRALGGDDTVTGSGGNDVVYGEAGNDILNGEPGHDVLDGGSDDDILNGGLGSDILTGGAGNDTFQVSGGYDTVTDFTAGGTDDRIDVSGFALLTDASSALGLGAQVGANVVFTFSYNQVLVLQNTSLAAMTAADFLLAPATPANVITGGGLSNNLTGTASDDLMIGNILPDGLYGGGGNDKLFGSGHNDYLLGEEGNDLIDGGADMDILVGGAGDDILLGGDTTSYPFYDYIYSGTGNNVMSGGEGGDVFVSEGANDIINGGDGRSYVYRSADGSSQIIGNSDVDIFIGGAFDSSDLFLGYDGDDYALSGAGNDELIGGNGNDVLLAGAGDDVLIAGDGDNYLYSGSGSNLMQGGANLDIMIAEGTDDILFGGDGTNYFYLQSTSTTISTGGNGLDILVGLGNSNDTAFGGADGDYFYGGGGNDGLFGEAGNDFIDGQAGNDIIDGGTGINNLFGGLGNDTFLVKEVDPGATNVIYDFTAGGSEDQVDLRGFGLTSFSQIEAMINAPGTVINGSLALNGGTGLQLYFNLGADQSSVWFLGINGPQLTASDFIFS